MPSPAPEVAWVLNQTRDEYPTGETLSAIPLERIDGDNAENLDGETGWTHSHSADLEEMNLMVASLSERPQTPMGTEYDLRGDAIVSCRVEGVHVDEHGAINPSTGDDATPTGNATDWDTLTDNIRRAILTNRTYPSVGRANTSYKDAFIENWNDQSSSFSDYYLLTFDVRLGGFEDLP